MQHDVRVPHIFPEARGEARHGLERVHLGEIFREVVAPEAHVCADVDGDSARPRRLERRLDVRPLVDVAVEYRRRAGQIRLELAIVVRERPAVCVFHREIV